MTDPNYYSEWTPSGCQTLLNEKNIDHRMYNQIRWKGKNPHKHVIMNSSLFLKNQRDFDFSCKTWANHVQSVTVPFDENSIDLLQNNTEIVIRKTYLYRRYRFTVEFSRGYKEPIDDLDFWIRDNLGENQDQLRWNPDAWWPKLYLVDESDLMLVKLTWPDKIKNITVVKIFDEVITDTGI